MCVAVCVDVDREKVMLLTRLGHSSSCNDATASRHVMRSGRSRAWRREMNVNPARPAHPCPASSFAIIAIPSIVNLTLPPSPVDLILHRFCTVRQQKIAVTVVRSPSPSSSSRALLPVATKLIINAARDQTSSSCPPLRRPIPLGYSYSFLQRPSLRLRLRHHGFQLQLVAADCGH